MMLKDVIRQLRKLHNKTQEEVADYLRVQRATYAKYENGTNAINIEALCKLADYYNVSTDFLLQRNSKIQNDENTEFLYLYSKSPPIFKDIALTLMKKAQEYSQSDILNENSCIPVFNSGVSALPTHIAESKLQHKGDQYYEQINVGDFAVISEDDSMVMKNINKGDYVIIRPQSGVNSGEVAFVLVKDRSLIRSVFEQNGYVQLVPANNNYNVEYFNKQDDIYIIGKMINIIKIK